MVEEKNLPPSSKIVLWLERSASLVVILSLITAAIVIVLVPFLANSWLHLPYLGVLYESTLVFTEANPIQPGTWALRNLNLPYGSRLAAIEDTQIQTIDQLHEEIAKYQVGDTVRIGVLNLNNETEQYTIQLGQFSTADQL